MIICSEGKSMRKHIVISTLFIFSSISPRLKSRGHKYFINKSHMLSFVLQYQRGGTLQSTWERVGILLI